MLKGNKKDTFNWAQSADTKINAAPPKIIPENAISYAELGSKGSQPLVLIEGMPEACQGLSRSIVKCGVALDLLSIGSVQLGLRELGSALGILRVVENKHLVSAGVNNEAQLRKDLKAVISSQRDCIEGCIKHQLFPSGEHLSAAGASFQLSLVQSASAFMHRSRAA